MVVHVSGSPQAQLSFQVAQQSNLRQLDAHREATNHKSYRFVLSPAINFTWEVDVLIHGPGSLIQWGPFGLLSVYPGNIVSFEVLGSTCRIQGTDHATFQLWLHYFPLWCFVG